MIGHNKVGTLMTWYACHVIFAFELKNQRKNEKYLALEDIVLVQAPDHASAREIAEAYRKKHEEIDGTTRVAPRGRNAGGEFQPANIIFRGVRKTVEIMPNENGNYICHENDISYNFLEFDNEKDLIQFADGETAKVCVLDG